MTAPTTALTRPGRTWPAVEVLAAYRAHVVSLPMNSCSRCARLRAAHDFLVRHPDLAAWMATPTPARLADLHGARPGRSPRGASCRATCARTWS